MGYSVSTKAAHALDILSRHCAKTTGTANTWVHNGKKYFWERGKEQPDGAATGSVWRFSPDGIYANRAGSYRIEPDGKVTKFTAWPFKWKDYHYQFQFLKDKIWGASMIVTNYNDKDMAEYDLILPSIMTERQLGIKV